MKLITLTVLLLLSQSVEALAAKKPLALIWRGPGVCEPMCGISATQAARKAGFRTMPVVPGFLKIPGGVAEKAFAEASVWVQPGGKSARAAKWMGSALLERVRRFVFDGGGYVGYCAGMFLATDLIGTTGKPGLGIVPGATELFLKNQSKGKLIPVTFPQGVREMYYAGGPMLHIDEEALRQAGGEVTSYYADGSVAGVNVPYGRGKVAVVGFHPEANKLWKIFKGIFSRQDGRWLSTEMMRWAAKD